MLTLIDWARGLPGWIKALAALAFVLGLVFWLGARKGAEAERRAGEKQAERVASRAREAGEELRGRANEASAHHEQTARDVREEAADAIEQIQRAPGGDLVIDRALACDALAAVRRMRARTGDLARSDPVADGDAAGEPCQPLPAGAPS